MIDKPAEELDKNLLYFGHPSATTHKDHFRNFRLKGKNIKRDVKHILLKETGSLICK